IPPVPPVPPGPDIEMISPEEKRENIEVIMDKMLSLRDPDSISVQPAEIKKILAEQIKQNHLPEVFDFFLLAKDPKRSYLGFGNVGYKDGWRPYKVNLYPNDLFGRDMTLAVTFRTEDTFLQMKDWIYPVLLSLFFTLSLLALFIYSIRMLLRHKKMLDMKNDFINHMSHEFKTPLAGISLGADMLIDKPGKMSPEQINKVAHIIRKQSDRLNKEITDVLLSAQLEENIHKVSVQFDLIETLKTQLGLFSLQLENKGARIETHYKPENISITGDEILWQKVFSNLLDNALKFSKESPEIIISVTRTANVVRVEFKDNGIGIAEKDLPHIFEKFYRSNYYRQSNIQGFGLGLNFVKKVIDSHKGKIRAESEPGKGTKIIIEING
ncbi:MAG TPA: HAMP domain-containing sensor histidine kinase, partial [Bacteroidia bacterium]|nr:HAMP domain-containing sensor histidine kinase [Bacteroidia bacterium]